MLAVVVAVFFILAQNQEAQRDQVVVQEILVSTTVVMQPLTEVRVVVVQVVHLAPVLEVEGAATVVQVL
jgi:hypothetical protein